MVSCGSNNKMKKRIGLTEKNKSRGTQQAAHPIHLVQNLPLTPSRHVHPRWGKVKSCSHCEPHAIPQRTQQSDIAPGGIGRNELGIQPRETERSNGHDEEPDVQAAAGDGSHFRGGSEGGELVDTGANTGKDVTANDYVHGLGGGGDDLCCIDLVRLDGRDVA